MTWSDIPRNPTAKALRQFAGAWLVFFFAFGLHQFLVRGHHRIGIGLLVMATVFGVLGLVKPAAVKWLFVGWMTAAFPIGWLISQIMLGIMFYGIITPVAFIFKLRGRDLMHRKLEPGRASFWMPKPTPEDVRSYFRQY